MTITQIARMLGKTRGQVAAMVKKLSLTGSDSRPVHYHAFDIEEIVMGFGLNPTVFYEMDAIADYYDEDDE